MVDMNMILVFSSPVRGFYKNKELESFLRGTIYFICLQSKHVVPKTVKQSFTKGKFAFSLNIFWIVCHQADSDTLQKIAFISRRS